MTTDDTERTVSGIEMTDGETDSFLTDQGYGTLSFARNGESYALPISFGYDDGSVYMHLLQFGEDSEKMAFLPATETACLTVTDVQGRFRWKSAVVRGPIREVSEAAVDTVEEALDDNGWFPTIFPPTEPMTDVNYVELQVDSATGRKGQAHQE